MKIFITGVAGFIGSNLAKRLLELHHQVIGIDNFSHGYERNIQEFKSNMNFEFVYGDIINPLLLRNHKADVIVHLASQKIPRYSNALRTLEENDLMLKNVVNQCIVDRCKILYVSSSDVYGKNKNIPLKENHDLILGPSTIKRWSYALSKIYGEQYVIAINDEYDLRYTIVRIFNTYGPNQNLTWWGGPQSIFITNAIKKVPLEIHGDGLQTRTFTYIDDTIDALVACVLEEKADNEIFNIGSNQKNEISIIDLAILMWKLINGDDEEPKLKYIPYSNFGRYEDVKRRVPDLTKIKKYFNYKPDISLTEGLIKTIKWQRDILKL